MFRTLSQLRQAVDQLIEQQGENALCASIIYTQEDISSDYEDENGELIDQDYKDLEAKYPGIVEYVLNQAGDNSYPYAVMSESIYDYIWDYIYKQ